MLEIRLASGWSKAREMHTLTAEVDSNLDRESHRRADDSKERRVGLKRAKRCLEVPLVANKAQPRVYIFNKAKEEGGEVQEQHKERLPRRSYIHDQTGNTWLLELKQHKEHMPQSYSTNC